MQLLMWLFALPFMMSLAAFLFPPVSPRIFKGIAFFMSLIPLGILLYGHGNWLGMSIHYPWVTPLSIAFYLHVDSLSIIFLYLVALIIPISMLAMQSKGLYLPNVFYGLVLLLQGLLIGFFTARDLALFTFLWESMLLPLYFIVNLWGGDKRESASLKFIIYMIAASALMVAAVLALFFVKSTFDLDALAGISSHLPYAPWLCIIFLLAFAVKTPLFPFHIWLPDVYCQAPTAGTILLSALLSKAGIYGILRIGFELFPDLMKNWSPFLLALAIVGVFYGALVAWVQKDFKRLIAYSSLSHVNFILVGIFVLTQVAHEGAILQALNHGITITALFLVAGWLEERIGTRLIGKISGMAKFLPHLCWLTLFFVLASVALPGTNNFIGELLILFGLFDVHPWVGAFLGLSIILSVIYMLRWMQKVYFEEPGFYKESWIDITGKELAIALPLVLLVIWIGVYPAPILKQIEPIVEKSHVVASLEDS